MQEFVEFLLEKNFNWPVESSHLDGEFHHFEDEDRKGWVRGFVNPWGIYAKLHDYKSGDEIIYTSPKGDQNLSPEDLKKWKEEYEKKKIAAEKERIELQLEVSKRVESEFQKYTTEGTSIYLSRKKITEAFGARFRSSSVDAFESDLVIPLRDIEGKLWSLQTINPAGDKSFTPGGRTDGLFHLLGKFSEKLLYLSEGFATSASVATATGGAVGCCFNAGNLRKVAEGFRKKYPRLKIIVAGDSDRFSNRNVGREKAIEASQAVNGIYVLPRFHDISTKPTDFNDLHCLEGLDACKRFLIGGAIEPRNKYNWTTYAELKKEKLPEIEWLVKDLLPEGGTSLLAGPPKGGKTTLVRYLIHCVLGGKDFLGMKVQKGKVLYLALEEHRGEFFKRMEKLGIDHPEDFGITFTLPNNGDRMLGLEAAMNKLNPRLVVIDTMFKFVDVDDGNAYNQVIKALKPIEDLGRDNGAHVMLVHHSKKGSGESGAVESVLGSQGIAAAFDTVISVQNKKQDNKSVYTLQTASRYSVGMEPSVLHHDPHTGVCSLSPLRTSMGKHAEEILSHLAKFKGESFPVTWIAKQLGIRGTTVSHALRALKVEGKVLEKSGQRGALLYELNPSFAGMIGEDDEE